MFFLRHVEKSTRRFSVQVEEAKKQMSFRILEITVAFCSQDFLNLLLWMFYDAVATIVSALLIAFPQRALHGSGRTGRGRTQNL